MDTNVIKNLVTLRGRAHDYSETIERGRDPIFRTLLAWDEDTVESEMRNVDVNEESSVADNVSVGRLTINFKAYTTRRRLMAPGVQREPIQHFEDDGQITAKYTYVNGDIFITQLAKTPDSAKGNGIIRWLKDLDEA